MSPESMRRRRGLPAGVRHVRMAIACSRKLPSIESNVSVLEAAVKSVPRVAVPLAVAYWTVTCLLLASDRETTNATAAPVRALPSLVHTASAAEQSVGDEPGETTTSSLPVGFTENS